MKTLDFEKVDKIYHKQLEQIVSVSQQGEVQDGVLGKRVVSRAAVCVSETPTWLYPKTTHPTNKKKH